MYQIFADGTLIYDSTIDDYKIGKGEITKEVDKSGSFVFSLYPDHFYYDHFVKLKTVVMVKKSGKVAFRGRVLNDVTDYWNKGDFTCEGELGFLQDSVVRPFEFTGTPADLFTKFIEEHNAQVDEFKRFKIGTVTVVDSNDYINRSTADYPTTWDVLTSALTGSDLGGHIYVTHGDDGTEELPTIHYVADFPKTATQAIEFGVNLKDYTKTTKAEDVATAVIPLGAETGSDGQRLTIEDVNDGADYLYNADAVAARGWVFKTVVWDDVTLAQNLKTKAQAWLDNAINQAVTIELTAIDLHLLDRSIESYNVCEYVHATSKPHGFDAVMLCNRQTMDLLHPDADTVTLGYQTATFTGSSTQMAANISTLGKRITEVKQTADDVAIKAADLATGLETTLRVAADGVTITDAEGNTVTINGSQIAASSITADQIDATDLKVDAANIKGTLVIGQIPDDVVTTGGLSGGTTTIDGACIQTGTISADRIDVATVTAGLVTVKGLSDGSTTIDGACIKTGTISADRIDVTNLNLSGVISFSDLSDSEEIQEQIDAAGGLDEDTVKTLITDELVQSPTIKGGEFYDLDDLGRLTLSTEDGRFAWLTFESLGTDEEGNLEVLSEIFSAGGTNYGGTKDLFMMKFADKLIMQCFSNTGEIDLFNVNIEQPLSDALDSDDIVTKLKTVLGLS